MRDGNGDDDDGEAGSVDAPSRRSYETRVCVADREAGQQHPVSIYQEVDVAPVLMPRPEGKRKRGGRVTEDELHGARGPESRGFEDEDYGPLPGTLPSGRQRGGVLIESARMLYHGVRKRHFTNMPGGPDFPGDRTGDTHYQRARPGWNQIPIWVVMRLSYHVGETDQKAGGSLSSHVKPSCLLPLASHNLHLGTTTKGFAGRHRPNY
ncbi:hypothetical protein QBC39DRAFT_432969 [Podospora conica]|nr:hypothetical protein QBC39DRAFT_432969 [Schizothecium conicum]